MEILTLNRQIFQQHESQYFIYLGAQVTRDGGGILDIKKRTSRICKLEYAQKIWGTRDISRNTKVRLFKTLVISVLLYGCETW